MKQKINYVFRDQIEALKQSDVRVGLIYYILDTRTQLTMYKITYDRIGDPLSLCRYFSDYTLMTTHKTFPTFRKNDK